MHRHALRDDQWNKIKDFLPGREGHVGGTAADNRLFVDAAASPRSFRPKPTANSRDRQTSHFIASATSSNASSANSSNIERSQRVMTSSPIRSLPPWRWCASYSGSTDDRA